MIPQSDFGAIAMMLAPLVAIAYAASLAIVPAAQLVIERAKLGRPVRSRIALAFYVLNAAVAAYLVYVELARGGTWHYVRSGGERGWLFLGALAVLVVHGWMGWRGIRALRGRNPPTALSRPGSGAGRR